MRVELVVPHLDLNWVLKHAIDFLSLAEFFQELSMDACSMLNYLISQDLLSGYKILLSQVLLCHVFEVDHQDRIMH